MGGVGSKQGDGRSGGQADGLGTPGSSSSVGEDTTTGELPAVQWRSTAQVGSGQFPQGPRSDSSVEVGAASSADASGAAARATGGAQCPGRSGSAAAPGAARQASAPSAMTTRPAQCIRDVQVRRTGITPIFVTSGRGDKRRPVPPQSGPPAMKPWGTDREEAIRRLSPPGPCRSSSRSRGSPRDSRSSNTGIRNSTPPPSKPRSPNELRPMSWSTSRCR